MSRKRVLIVVSSFYPAMLADMHRARMLGFDLPEAGWDVEILSPNASYQRPQNLDTDSQPFFSAGVPVHNVGPWMPRVFNALGVGSIGWRAWVPMYRAGSALLASGRFDLVYFSTTQFPLMCLGRRWLAKYGVPYVLDIQDPWYRPQRKYFTTKHVLKARVTNWLYKRMEHRAVIASAGLVAVSPMYLDELNERYADQPGSWSQQSRQGVIPFAASHRDLESVREIMNASVPTRNRHLLKLVYVGAGGNTRAAAFEMFCSALTQIRSAHCDLVNRVRVSLYGTTGSVSTGTDVLYQVAERHRVHDLVEERTEQISYFDSIRLAEDADGLLILGVDDRGYTPSKLFSYLLYGKPVLASFQVGSPAEKFVLRNSEAAAILQFGGDEETSPDRAARILLDYLNQVAEHRRDDRSSLVEPYLARAMAKQHAELFDRIVGRDASTVSHDCREAPVA